MQRAWAERVALASAQGHIIRRLHIPRRAARTARKRRTDRIGQHMAWRQWHVGDENSIRSRPGEDRPRAQPSSDPSGGHPDSESSVDVQCSCSGSFRKPMRHADELDTPSDPSEPRGREPQDDAKQQRKCIAAAQP
ncbi:hypothetical protein NOR_04955 [Metarhizium rileyi]|uniref:Uncharacterized protein n=1 Tax=Metarhizium rileyi (strain RCEF 4871) TaxID=1649241 RepID=A0A167D9J0_METRR|nr:hypothetical protein NOR_04955 [Metarhizium rileyi RCEF 4871]